MRTSFVCFFLPSGFCRWSLAVLPCSTVRRYTCLHQSSQDSLQQCTDCGQWCHIATVRHDRQYHTGRNKSNATTVILFSREHCNESSLTTSGMPTPVFMSDALTTENHPNQKLLPYCFWYLRRFSHGFLFSDIKHVDCCSGFIWSDVATISGITHIQCDSKRAVVKYVVHALCKVSDICECCGESALIQLDEPAFPHSHSACTSR